LALEPVFLNLRSVHNPQSLQNLALICRIKFYETFNNMEFYSNFICHESAHVLAILTCCYTFNSKNVFHCISRGVETRADYRVKKKFKRWYILTNTRATLAYQNQEGIFLNDACVLKNTAYSDGTEINALAGGFTLERTKGVSLVPGIPQCR